MHVLTDQFEKEGADNYKFKMDLDKKAKFGELFTNRHTQDVTLLQDMLTKKRAELEGIKNKRNKAQADYMAMSELQNLITECSKTRQDIEVKVVDLQHFQITIKGMEEFTNFLLDQKDRLEDEKKQTDEANEDLAKQVRVREETAQKRIINKLQKDRNPEIKDLMLKEDDQKVANEDFSNKHRNETEKTD